MARVDLGPIRPAPHLWRLTCERCGHEWERVGLPDRCPVCDSRYWDAPPGSLKRGRPAAKR
jgi:predicted Zn-ribbon and HTH transcriptional regulator